MMRSDLFFKNMQCHVLNLKINIFWRLEYYLLVLNKKNGADPKKL
jgi:hypothetical protein